jgi:hypothetical protein
LKNKKFNFNTTFCSSYNRCKREPHIKLEPDVWLDS